MEVAGLAKSRSSGSAHLVLGKSLSYWESRFRFSQRDMRVREDRECSRDTDLGPRLDGLAVDWTDYAAIHISMVQTDNR